MRRLQSLLLHYGTEIPDPASTRALADVAVVLQDYHPLCVEGLFAEFFPACRRYLYFNPVRASVAYVQAAGLEVEGATPDAYGNLALDLACPRTRAHALEVGRGLIATEGVDGLFLDDLDAWSDTPARRTIVRDFLSELDAPTPPRLILNRAFGLWRHVASLDAVLLENLTPAAIGRLDGLDRIWIRRMLRTHVALLAKTRPAVAVFALSYGDGPEAAEAPPHDPQTAQCEGWITSIPCANRRLDTWPDQLL